MYIYKRNTKRKNFSPGAPFPLPPVVALFPPPPPYPREPQESLLAGFYKEFVGTKLEKEIIGHTSTLKNL